jgi:hypothetical protein
MTTLVTNTVVLVLASRVCREHTSSLTSRLEHDSSRHQAIGRVTRFAAIRCLISEDKLLVTAIQGTEWRDDNRALHRATTLMHLVGAIRFATDFEAFQTAGLPINREANIADILRFLFENEAAFRANGVELW